MNIKSIKLDNKIISQEHKPFIIAEIGQAHDGSWELRIVILKL